jgi:hypothetical protein
MLCTINCIKEASIFDVWGTTENSSIQNKTTKVAHSSKNFLPVPRPLFYPKIFALIGKKDNGSNGVDSGKQAA